MKRALLLLAASGAALAAAHAQTPPHTEPETETRPIGEVVVTGVRTATDVRHLPMTVAVVGRKRIEHDGGASLLPLLTEQVPGLFTTGRGVLGYGVSGGAAGQMSLRGIGGPAQAGTPTTAMLVLIDGHPQYMGLMGHPIADACQSLLAERVEVVRGPASVLYGSNAMGGVINIVTRRAERDGVHTDADLGYGSWNTLQAEVSNRVRAGRFTSAAGASYARTDGHRARMGFEQYGGYLRLGYRIADAWSVTADANITHFNASNPGPVTAPIFDNDQRITRGAASVAVENRYEKTSGAVSLFCNWGRHRIDDGHAADEAPLDYRFGSRDRMAGISAYQSVQLFRGNRLTAGIDLFRFGGEAWNRYVAGERKGERDELADKTLYETAAYVDFRQQLTPWLTFDAGLRADRHSHVGTEWVPQAGLSAHLPRAVELKASAAKGFRYPTIREMYMFPPQNPDLRPERLWSYELSFSQRLTRPGLDYGVNIFFIDGENLILRVPVDGRPANINSGRIRNAGVEGQIGWQCDASWRLDANYSYLHMKYPVLAAPEHKLYAGAQFVRRRWNVSTGVQYVAGLRTALAAAGSGSDSEEEFVLWNLRCTFRASRVVSLWVRGENLLAQRYEINAGFPMPRATVMAGLNLHM